MTAENALAEALHAAISHYHRYVEPQRDAHRALHAEEAAALLAALHDAGWTLVPAVTETDLRAALEQALDRMEAAWRLLEPSIWSDAARVQGGPAESVSQALYFGIEEAERALHRAALAGTTDTEEEA